MALQQRGDPVRAPVQLCEREPLLAEHDRFGVRRARDLRLEQILDVSRCAGCAAAPFHDTSTLARSDSESIDSCDRRGSEPLAALSASVRKCSVIRPTVAGLNSSVLYSQVVFMPILRSLTPSSRSNFDHPFSCDDLGAADALGSNLGRCVLPGGVVVDDHRLEDRRLA